MKKVIGGSLYDTKTAKWLGRWSNGYPTNDFSYCSEELYRTKAGKYFLYGEGGAYSAYATIKGDGRGWGERIIPMTREEAMQWAEEHLDGDEYEKIFGPVEDDGREALNLTISIQTKAKLREEAEKRKISISALVEELIAKFYEG